MTKLKIKASKATHENIQDLDRDQLLKLCGALIDSRNTSGETNKHLSDMQKRDKHLRECMMPQAGTMIEMLADRAGLAHRPEVRKMIKALGDGTYIQWSEENHDHPALPADAASVPNPRAGDAEMVLGGRLHELLTNLTDACARVDMPRHIEDAVMELATTVDARMDEAIKDGFKDLPADWAPATPADFEKVEQIGSINEIQHELHEILTNLDFGMSLLRTDLRAGMYRGVIRSIAYLARSMEDAADKERLALRAQRETEEAPF